MDIKSFFGRTKKPIPSQFEMNREFTKTVALKNAQYKEELRLAKVEGQQRAMTAYKVRTPPPAPKVQGTFLDRGVKYISNIQQAKKTQQFNRSNVKNLKSPFKQKSNLKTITVNGKKYVSVDKLQQYEQQQTQVQPQQLPTQPQRPRHNPFNLTF